MLTQSRKSVITLAVAAMFAGTPIVVARGSAVHAAGEYLTLNSFSGNAGSTVEVSGGGFVPDAALSIAAPGGATVSASADASGNFGPVAYVIPVVQAGAEVITATAPGESASNSYYVQPFLPSLTLSAGSVNPFGSVVASATGFAPNEGVVFSVAGTTVSATADSTGSVSATLAIPDVAAGTQTVTATGQSSAAVATGYLYVNGFYPSVVPSSYYLLPGQDLSFTGSGFAPNETVNVEQVSGTSSQTVASFTAGSDGSFMDAGTVTIPTSAANTGASYSLVGQTSQASAGVYVSVGQYFGQVSPSAYYVMPGQALSFNGSGFEAGETISVTEGADSTVLTTITADQDGSFTNAGTITVPFSAAGTSPTYNFVASQSGSTSSAQVTVGQYYAQVSPSAYFVMPGQTISFTGSGFAPNETVSVTQGTDPTVLTTITTDQDGSFMNAGSVTVGYDQAGTSPTFTFTASQSQAVTTAQITVGQLYPTLDPSSYYLLPGSTFSASGTGYLAGETVDLTLDGTAVGSVVADQYGDVSFTGIAFPSTAKASLDLTATGETSLATVTDNVAVGQYYPYSVSSNYYAQPGTPITITGGGFAPNETVTVAYGNGLTATGTTDQYGNLAGVQIAMPSATDAMTDSSVITLTGQYGESSTLSLTDAPFMTQLSPSTYYATPGTAVTLTGSGFVAGESVTINQGTTLVGTATADQMGGFTFPVTLPYGVNSVSYSAVGASSAAPSSVTIGMAQFYPGLTLSSYYAQGGTAETITGSGFAPGEAVNLTWDGASIGTATADQMGGFSFPTTVPYAVAGDKAVVATGQTSGASATTSFTEATVYVSLQLGQYAGAPGTAIDFIGTGYMPGETVDITTDRDSGVVYSLTADANGDFNDSGFILPAGYAAGNLTLTATGEHSLNAQSIVFYVTGQ